MSKLGEVEESERLRLGVEVRTENLVRRPEAHALLVVHEHPLDQHHVHFTQVLYLFLQRRRSRVAQVVRLRFPKHRLHVDYLLGVPAILRLGRLDVDPPKKRNHYVPLPRLKSQAKGRHLLEIGHRDQQQLLGNVRCCLAELEQRTLVLLEWELAM